MLNRAAGLLIWVLAALPATVAAYPDGAPWGAANPAAQENCASCHFGNEAVLDSASLVLADLPSEYAAGETYQFFLRLTDIGMAIAGFQIIVDTGARPNGVLRSSAVDVEFTGSAIRSTKPRSNDDGVIGWQITWIAPEEISGPITFFSAASAANDDGSPFDDTIHYKQKTVSPVATERKK